MMRVDKVDIKFGYSCNNNCIHCVVAGHRERLSKEGKLVDRNTEKIKEIIREAKEKGTSLIVFTGGEPTLRKDFFELLKFAKNLGLRICLQTNGRMFCIKDFAKRTLQIAPEMHFEIAIHSDKRENHDKITRVGGSFEQTLQGIKILKKFGANSLNFKVVISRLNYKDLKNIVKLADRLGVKQVDVAFPHGMGNALKYWHDVVPRYGEIIDYMIEAIKISNKLGISISFETIPYCFLKGFEKHVNELGYLSEFLKGQTSEVRQIGDPTMDWQQKRLSIKTKTTKCRECKYYHICEGVWREYIDFYGTKEFKPVKGKKIKTRFDLKELLKKSK